MRSWTDRQYNIDRRLISGMGVVIVLVTVLVLSLLAALRYDIEREEAIRERYYPQLLLAEQARTAMIDQQAGVRGFIITGDERFLESFIQGRANFLRARDGMAAFEIDDAGVVAVRDEQFALAEAWHAEVALPEIESRRDGSLDNAAELAILEQSRTRIDAFRAANDAYQAALREEIDSAVDDVNAVQAVMFFGSALGGAAALLLTAFVCYKLLQAIRTPLSTLTAVAAAVDRGEMDRRAPPLVQREFDILGRAINQMLDSLAATVAETRVQQRRTAAIVDSASEGIVVIDSTGSVTNINPSAARMFETTIDEACDRPAANLGLFTDEEIREIANDASARGVQPVVRRRGERVLSAAISSLQGDGESGSSGSVWVLRDVTELAQIDEMKSEFISIVSHELRTPLTAIKGFTDLILEGEVGEISEQQREFLTIVQSNSDRLVALINDMLDISRIESGRITLNPETIDVAGAIEQAVTALRPLIEEKGLSVQTQLAPEQSEIVADQARLQQILTNLISNACKYTPAGGWITLRSEPVDGQLAISVSDTGIGIPPEALPHIFSKFYRVDQPLTRDVGGTGLGLAITKSLVEMHGGKVAIASRVGVGTTVRFTLPTESPQDEDDGEDLDARPTVLVVSDDPLEREAWERALGEIQATIVVARGASAAAAIGEAELCRPHVIVVRAGPAGDDRLSLTELWDELRGVPALDGTPVVAVASALEIPDETRDFTVLDAATSPRELAAAVAALLPPADGQARRGRVLVAEDDADMAAWLRRLLVRNGYDVSVVRDGLAAVVRAIEIMPDAIVLDVNMPKMGASEVLPQLRSNPTTRDIPVVVVSGTLPDSGDYFLAAGAAAFFVKPFDGDQLIRRLVRLGSRT